MKKRFYPALSLVLSLVMLFTLVPSSVRAEDEDEGDDEEDTGIVSGYVTLTSMEDIIIKPKTTDGHVRFNSSSDVESVTFRGNDGIKHAADRVMSVEEALAEVCRRALAEQISGKALDNAGLEYISYIDLKGTQGTIYDGYNTEGDTGAGVTGAQRYYYGATSASNYKIGSLRFVPKTSFTGDAQITYYGYFTYLGSDEDGKATTRTGSYSGRLYITVGKQEPGIAYSTDGEPARFSSEDFSSYSLAVTGRTFKYISFRLPSTSEGTLYYNYIDKDIYDYAVPAGSRYYRTSAPMVDKVYFVPAKDYEGYVYIEFNGVDSADAEIRGELVIKVTAYGAGHNQPRAEGPFVYKVSSGRPVSLSQSDFEKAIADELGQGLKFLCLNFASLPPADSGTLYDDSATGSYHYVRAGADYYYPSSIRFSANIDYTGVVSIPVVVTASNGAHFDSIVNFVVSDSGGNSGLPLHYSVEPERRVYLIASDFSDACYKAFGGEVYRVHFNSLPPSSAGTLYYNDNITVTTGKYDEYYREQLNSVSFLANAGFTGTVTFSFTAYAFNYTSSNRRAYSGTVTITSKAVVEERTPIGGTAKPLNYSSTGTVMHVGYTDILNAVGSSLPTGAATITFSRPDTAAGRLCIDFVSISQYTELDASKAYPIGEIMRISFLPKAGFSGTERIDYTVRDAGGNNSYGGNIFFTVTPPTVSQYFNDMRNCSWAVPAADFFRTYRTVYGVTSSDFGPSMGMRRGDFVLMLDRLFSFPDAWTTSSFSDVDRSVYYAEAIANAMEAGVIVGIPIQVEIPQEPIIPDDAEEGAEPIIPEPIYETRLIFDPNGAITREDAALFIYRALLWSGRDISPGTYSDIYEFKDSGDVSPDRIAAVAALVKLGVINGDYAHLYPDKPLTRAQAVTMLYRALV